MAPNLWNSHLLPFAIKDILQILEANNPSSATILGNIVIHIKPNIAKIGWKLREPIRFKKKDGRTDRRTTGGSASDKFCWLCQQRSLKLVIMGLIISCLLYHTNVNIHFFSCQHWGFWRSTTSGRKNISINKPYICIYIYLCVCWEGNITPYILIYICARPRSREGTWEWWLSFRTLVRPCVRQRFPTIIWKSNHSINFKFGVSICWISVQNWFAFGRHWPNFGPVVARKRLKMGQNGGFQPLSETVFTQSNSNLVCTFIGLVFRTDSLSCYVSQILILY